MTPPIAEVDCDCGTCRKCVGFAVRVDSYCSGWGTGLVRYTYWNGAFKKRELLDVELDPVGQ